MIIARPWVKLAVGGAALALIWGLSPFLRRKRVKVTVRRQEWGQTPIRPANEDVEVPWGVEV